MSDVRIRRAEGLADIHACVDLQREVWKFTEPEHIAAPPLLILGNRYGGCVLLAESSDGKAIGFSYALLCSEPDRSLFWWSHMTAVAPAHQGKSVGFQLKLAQRTEALSEGIDRICWTFDPLQALNAHFNIRKLGTQVLRYEANIYGESSSPLHHGMPTDRLLVEWNLESPAVVNRLGGAAHSIPRDLDVMARITAPGGPDSHAFSLEEKSLVLEIPTDINTIRQTDPESARNWQRTLEQVFNRCFRSGYDIIDFLRIEEPRPQALYVLERQID